MILRVEKPYETFTTEFHNIDPDLDQIYTAIKGMLIASGWQQITIDQYIIELAAELTKDHNKN